MLAKRAAARILIVIALVLSLLSGCTDVRLTVIVAKTSDGAFEVRDLCGAGIGRVSVYRSSGERNGVVTDADAEWMVELGADQKAASAIALFIEPAGYVVTQKSQVWPPQYDFFVIVDGYQQFYGIPALPPGGFSWDGRTYSAEQEADVVRAIEKRYPSLAGKCKG